MSVFTKIDDFALQVLNGQHSLNVDQLAAFLTNAAPASPTNISDLTAATGVGNITSTNITTTGTSQVGGVGSLALVDAALAATGAVGPFQYVYIYNTVNGNLICSYDYGSVQNLVAGQSLIIDFTSVNQFLFSLTIL